MAALQSPPTLYSRRLRVRCYNADDTAEAYAMYGDPVCARWEPWEPHADVERTREVLRSYVQNFRDGCTPLVWAAQRRSDDVLVGQVALAALMPVHRRAELAWMTRPIYWGQGFATEAAACLIDFAFTVLKLHRVQASCDPRNRESVRVMEKLGMRHEGVGRDALWIKNEWVSRYVAALIDTDPRPAENQDAIISSTAGETARSAAANGG